MILTNNRMLRDAEHFKSKIGGLDGAGDAGDYIVDLVKLKSVPKRKAPEPAPVPEPDKESNGTNGKSSSEITEPKTDEKVIEAEVEKKSEEAVTAAA